MELGNVPFGKANRFTALHHGPCLQVPSRNAPFQVFHPSIRSCHMLDHPHRSLGRGAYRRRVSTPCLPTKTIGPRSPWTVPSGLTSASTRAGPYRIWTGSGSEKSRFPATTGVPREENPLDSGPKGVPVGCSFPEKDDPRGGSGFGRRHVSTNTFVWHPIQRDRPFRTDHEATRTDEARETCAVELLERILFLEGRWPKTKRNPMDRAGTKSPGYDGIYRRGC